MRVQIRHLQNALTELGEKDLGRSREPSEALVPQDVAELAILEFGMEPRETVRSACAHTPMPPIRLRPIAPALSAYACSCAVSLFPLSLAGFPAPSHSTVPRYPQNADPSLRPMITNHLIFSESATTLRGPLGPLGRRTLGAAPDRQH
jgi:hypothetical protein